MLNGFARKQSSAEWWARSRLLECPNVKFTISFFARILDRGKVTNVSGRGVGMDVVKT